jgi:hypothetical protein
MLPMPELITVCGRDIKVQGRLVRTAFLDADKYHFIEDPLPLLEGLKKCDRRIDLFTFMQRIDEPTPRFPYPMELDNLAVLPVSTFGHWWNQQIRSFPRNRARQAEKKGVTLREVPFSDDLIKGIRAIYNECPVRQGKPFRHYGKDIDAVRKEASTYLDFSIFIGAFLGDELIGFVKLVTDERRTQANLMHIVAMVQHRDKAPTNALIAHSVRVCAERHIPYLVYQNFVYGKKLADSLTHFKEVNGFSRVDLPRYYVPLTVIGRAALRLGLHHRFIDHFPTQVVTKLLEFRNAWHRRKTHVTTETS